MGGAWVDGGSTGSATVTPEQGGEASYTPGQLQVRIPPGGVTGQSILRIGPASVPPPPGLSDLNLLAEVELRDAAGQLITALGQPAEIQFSYANVDLSLVDESGPVFTDTDGPVYAPVIVIGVSEALSVTTVTTATVTLTDGAGTPITGTVRVDGGVNQIVFSPRVALSNGQYTATVTVGVADVAGNGLAAPYVWRFTVSDGTAGAAIYLPALQK